MVSVRSYYRGHLGLLLPQPLEPLLPRWWWLVVTKLKIVTLNRKQMSGWPEKATSLNWTSCSCWCLGWQWLASTEATTLSSYFFSLLVLFLYTCCNFVYLWIYFHLYLQASTLSSSSLCHLLLEPASSSASKRFQSRLFSTWAWQSKDQLLSHSRSLPMQLKIIFKLFSGGRENRSDWHWRRKERTGG